MHVHLDDLHPTVDPLANAQFRSAPRRIGIVLDSVAIKTDDDILQSIECY